MRGLEQKMSITYGYVRVSAADQNEARQVDAMLKEGIEQQNIYIDKQSGKDFNRKAYRKLFRKVKEGDTIYIKSIDRLGRNYKEIQEQWNEIKKKKVYIVVMDMPLLDTRHSVDGLTGQFIADLVLQILSYVAQVERDNIKQRQAEGIKAAQSRGVKFGRPRKNMPEGFRTAVQRVNDGELTYREGARQIGVSKSTFYKKAMEYNRDMNS